MAAGCRANAAIVSRHDAEQGPASRAFLPNGPGGLPEYPELRDAQPGRGTHAADQVCSSAPVDSYRKAESCRGRPRRRSGEGWRRELEEIDRAAPWLIRMTSLLQIERILDTKSRQLPYQDLWGRPHPRSTHPLAVIRVVSGYADLDDRPGDRSQASLSNAVRSHA